jgi:hypothetical protein
MRRKALRRAVAAMPLKVFSMPFPMTLNLSLIILIDLIRGQSIWVVNGDVMRAKREPPVRRSVEGPQRVEQGV